MGSGSRGAGSDFLILLSRRQIKSRIRITIKRGIQKDDTVTDGGVRKRLSAKGLLLIAGGETVVGNRGQNAFWFMFAWQMYGNRFEEIA